MQFTENEFRAYLRKRAQELGSQQELARELCITPGYLSDILSGSRHISESVAEAAGFTKESVYKWRKQRDS